LAGQIEEYDFGAVRFVANKVANGRTHHYLLGPGDLLDDEDFEASIMEAIQANYPHLQAISLNGQSGTMGTSGWLLEQLTQSIQTARFAIYRVDEACSPPTFLALGISIGLNRPFLMVTRAGQAVPQDVQGIGLYQFPNFVSLRRDLLDKHQAFFDRYGST
jgi:hypothetical protein